MLREYERPGSRSKWLFSGLLALWTALFCATFPYTNPPADGSESVFGWWLLSYICLVPWAVGVCGYRSRRWVYVISYLWSVVFFFFCLCWLWNVAYIPIGQPGPGQIRIPAGSAALGVYLGAFIPPMAWVTRHLYWKRRVSLTLVLPLVWVTGEFARSVLVLEFPWFTLAQSHYRSLTLIQICDLVGSYGVTFVIAMVNGLLADFVLLRWFHPHQPPRPGMKFLSVATVAVVMASIIYGRFQLSRDTLAPGPRVAVIQGNYPLEVEPITRVPPQEKKAAQLGFVREAASEQPDLYVLPEAPWFMILNREYRTRSSTPPPPYQSWALACHRDFLSVVAETGASLITGAMSMEFYPHVAYPTEARFNSAFFYSPEEPEPERYDKVHLVLFGEYVPFRGGRLHFLYKWLNSITPWGQNGREYSLTAGSKFSVFEMTPASEPERTYSFGVLICFEDVMPYVSRNFVIGPDGKKRADFLVNISNDGWFHGGVELVQHLSLAVFRSIENRVGMVRSANTGISAFIDPNGRIYSPVTRDGRLRGPDVEGFSVAAVMTDSRVSLYSRWGDWFAGGITVLVGLAMLDAVWLKRRESKLESGRADARRKRAK